MTVAKIDIEREARAAHQSFRLSPNHNELDAVPREEFRDSVEVTFGKTVRHTASVPGHCAALGRPATGVLPARV